MQEHHSPPSPEPSLQSDPRIFRDDDDESNPDVDVHSGTARLDGPKPTKPSFTGQASEFVKFTTVLTAYLEYYGLAHHLEQPSFPDRDRGAAAALRIIREAWGAW